MTEGRDKVGLGQIFSSRMIDSHLNLVHRLHGLIEDWNNHEVGFCEA
ncbi:hypothetical protein [Rhodococcus sp. BH4]|nr:hypothetical protein [Rhodococcus sp. BH4]